MRNLSHRLSLIALIAIAILFSAASAQRQPGRFNRTRSYDVQHYKISISFNQSERSISATTVVTLKPLSDGFSWFSLDAEGLRFTDVRLLGERTPLPYSIGPGNIKIMLPRAYSGGEAVSVSLTYSASPKKGVYFVNESRSGDRVTRSAQIWTQGEAEESRYWFPSYDFPDDKATSEQEVTVQEGETVVANGELQQIRRNSDGTLTYHYHMGIPHSSYLTSFVVGKFVKTEEFYRGIPLGFYLYPNRQNTARSIFAKTKEMLRVFEDLTATPYPYNKYDQTIVAEFNFGGMENITATTLSDRDVALADTPLGRDVVEDLVSHELAHSWFGNLVTCRNWAEIWLNEGFATFMEAAWRERAYGRDNYLAKLRADAAEFLFDDQRTSLKHGVYNQIAKPDDSLFDPTAYKKGGAVVHMLRETVGDKVFWAAIAKYLGRHRFGNVESTDLRSVMEEESGLNLQTFFDQWVYGTDYPKLSISPIFNRRTGILTVTVRQTQVPTRLTPAAFDIPLEFAIETPKGTKNVSMRLTKRLDSAEFQIGDMPTSIEADPNLRVPIKTVNMQRIVLR